MTGFCPDTCIHYESIIIDLQIVGSRFDGNNKARKKKPPEIARQVNVDLSETSEYGKKSKSSATQPVPVAKVGFTYHTVRTRLPTGSLTVRIIRLMTNHHEISMV